jgi:hypothetical protein
MLHEGSRGRPLLLHAPGNHGWRGLIEIVHDPHVGTRRVDARDEPPSVGKHRDPANFLERQIEYRLRRIGEAARLRDAQCDFFEPLFLRSVLGGVPAATQ